jgi:hypothetical protein
MSSILHQDGDPSLKDLVLGSGVFSPVKNGREGLLVRAPMQFW